MKKDASNDDIPAWARPMNWQTDVEDIVIKEKISIMEINNKTNKITGGILKGVFTVSAMIFVMLGGAG